ncbi:hypothetical protein DEU56DRAFT_918878 [Suillus clintonianus]|uniref:uncharacterized protein n=1 Tax=Suillus clintonianus TaxID=1904413 RepID=UPI001B883176|nr:uncharacterized protein DEU56DRAFT_918878 [Suillus clintonianus]KAG2118408.1 hypothetical protein DEU56DRAFT_918878 [Suillus clintonianus]
MDSARTSDIVDALQKDLDSIDDYETPDFDTAYSRLAATCNPSTNLNELEVRAIIIEHQQQLDAVQLKASNPSELDESDRARKLRRRLLEQEDEIIESQHTHRRPVSTLWHFPTEILSLIFVYCLPDDKYMLPHPEKAPVLLTRVCRRWREVAVDMPGLWCKLSMGHKFQRSAACCDSWLERTQGHPLSLAFWRGRNNHWIESRSLLQPYITQVTSLALLSDSGASLPVVTDFIALEELTIFADTYHPMLDVAHSISQSPPTLRSFNIPRPRFELESFSDFKPALWANLTNVQITVDQPHTISHLLYLCPDLTSLLVGISFNAKQVLEPFTHTKLRSLSIVSGGWNRGGAIVDLAWGLFDAVSLPELRALEVHYVQPWPHEGFKAFLTRSNCPLESLIFGPGVMTTDEQRAEYVALIHSLQVVVDHMRPNDYFQLKRKIFMYFTK